jgi:hypothetical protein
MKRNSMATTNLAAVGQKSDRKPSQMATETLGERVKLSAKEQETVLALERLHKQVSARLSSYIKKCCLTNLSNYCRSSPSFFVA